MFKQIDSRRPERNLVFVSGSDLPPTLTPFSKTFTPQHAVPWRLDLLGLKQRIEATENDCAV